MTPEQRTKFNLLIENDLIALNKAARALADKLRASESESPFLNDELNLAFASVSDGFSVVVAMHGWIELVENEHKLRVHSCSSLLQKFNNKKFIEALKPVLYQTVEFVQREPRKLLAVAEGSADAPA